MPAQNEVFNNRVLNVQRAQSEVRRDKSSIQHENIAVCLSVSMSPGSQRDSLHKMPSERSLPNIVVTGTPGVGKSTTCAQLVSLSADTAHAMKILDINQLVKDEKCHDGYDERLGSWIVDEERLLDEVEKVLYPAGGGSGGDEERRGGWVIDWHACDLFPERWVDLVAVLRCEDTRVFHDRLAKRGYGEEKMQENIDAEIFGVVAEEARAGFEEGVVVELKSETVEHVEENCARVMEWVERWIEEHKDEEKRGNGEEEADGYKS